MLSVKGLKLPRLSLIGSTGKQGFKKNFSIVYAKDITKSLILGNTGIT